MTYIPRREITGMIPNKFEAIRVLALECRRLNDEIRAREDAEVEGKLTTLAVKQLLEGKVTYYDAKERREQERSEAMLSAAEGLLDIDEPMMMETDYELELQESGELPEGTEPAEAAVETAAAEAAEADADAPAEESTVTEEATIEDVAEAAPAEAAPTEPEADADTAEDSEDAATEDEESDDTVKESPGA